MKTFDRPRYEALIAEFRQFRATTKPRARIPEKLKSESIALLRSGLSPKEFAKASGVKPSRVREWLKKTPPPQTAPRVLKVIEPRPVSPRPREEPSEVHAALSTRIMIEGRRIVIELPL